MALLLSPSFHLSVGVSLIFSLSIYDLILPSGSQMLMASQSQSPSQSLPLIPDQCIHMKSWVANKLLIKLVLSGHDDLFPPNLLLLLSFSFR